MGTKNFKVSPPPWKEPEDLVRMAEKSNQPPPEPEGGIPKQWLPGWIRWPVRAAVLPFVWLDLACQRFVRFFFKTPYKEVGKCYQRGNCCYYIVIPAPQGLMTRLFYFWHTQINGFFSRHPDPMEVDGQKVVVLGCRYLQKDGRCGHHRMRPAICREWPRIEYFGPPKILKGCGFKAVPRDPQFDPYPQGDEEASLTEPRNRLNILK